MPTPFTLEKRFGEQLEAELDKQMEKHKQPYFVAIELGCTPNAVRNQLLNFGWHAEKDKQGKWIWRKTESVAE
jgi:hypothetical protein